jgi:hypothetical protein
MLRPGDDHASVRRDRLLGPPQPRRYVRGALLAALLAALLPAVLGVRELLYLPFYLAYESD